MPVPYTYLNDHVYLSGESVDREKSPRF